MSVAISEWQQEWGLHASAQASRLGLGPHFPVDQVSYRTLSSTHVEEKVPGAARLDCAVRTGSRFSENTSWPFRSLDVLRGRRLTRRAVARGRAGVPGAMGQGRPTLSGPKLQLPLGEARPASPAAKEDAIKGEAQPPS